MNLNWKVSWKVSLNTNWKVSWRVSPKARNSSARLRVASAACSAVRANTKANSKWKANMKANTKGKSFYAGSPAAWEASYAGLHRFCAMWPVLLRPSLAQQWADL